MYLFCILGLQIFVGTLIWYIGAEFVVGVDEVYPSHSGEKVEDGWVQETDRRVRPSTEESVTDKDGLLFCVLDGSESVTDEVGVVDVVR